MGKSSAPATPDYVGAANAQGQMSKENLNMQTYANRPTINTPFGTQSWQTGTTTDPATGQEVTTWQQNNTLAPGLQNALENQIGLQQGRSGLAYGFMNRVADEYSQPFDYSNMPQLTSANAPASLQTRLTDYAPGLATNVEKTALPQFDSNYRDTVANTLMQRMQPVHDYQNRQLETNLSNKGFQVGSEAYKRAFDEQNARQAAERFNALNTAGDEAQRLYNMQMGTAQQGFNQNLGAAQFQNQALGQAAALDQSRLGFGNNAIAQQYGLNQQYANAQNQLRQQAIAEQMQRRGMSLNEMNALMSGQQVSMPSMPSFSFSGQAQTPNLVGALDSQYQANLAANNAQNAQSNAILGSFGQLAGAAIPYMFSDARLKTDIRKIGEVSAGISLYRYRWVGSTIESDGVLAQEVQKVRPDLVRVHPSGYLQVNYAGVLA